MSRGLSDGGKVATCAPAPPGARGDDGACSGSLATRPAAALRDRSASRRPWWRDRAARRRRVHRERRPRRPRNSDSIAAAIAPRRRVGRTDLSSDGIVPSTRGAPGAFGFCAGSNTSPRRPVAAAAARRLNLRLRLWLHLRLPPAALLRERRRTAPPPPCMRCNCASSCWLRYCNCSIAPVSWRICASRRTIRCESSSPDPCATRPCGPACGCCDCAGCVRPLLRRSRRRREAIAVAEDVVEEALRRCGARCHTMKAAIAGAAVSRSVLRNIGPDLPLNCARQHKAPCVQIVTDYPPKSFQILHHNQGLNAASKALAMAGRLFARRQRVADHDHLLAGPRQALEAPRRWGSAPGGRTSRAATASTGFGG